MADIDFDALDQAVNSLMAPGASAPVESTPPAPVAAVAAAPAFDPQAPVTVPVRVIPTPIQTVPRPGTGRVMDVVAPAPSPAPTVTPAPLPAFTPVPVDTPDTPVISLPEAAEPTVAAWGAPATEAPETMPVTPPASPFLDGAKVDKRPLGAFSDPSLEPASVELSPLVNQSDEPAGIETPMPEELSADLLHIESDEPTSLPFSAPVSGDKPTDAPKTTSVFDTKTYHQPLAHPAKGKSGRLWVMWIVILLVVGGGVGAAVYFFVLPHV